MAELQPRPARRPYLNIVKLNLAFGCVYFGASFVTPEWDPEMFQSITEMSEAFVNYLWFLHLNPWPVRPLLLRPYYSADH